MRTKTLLMMVLAGTLIGACGGDGDGDAGTVAPTSSVAPPTTVSGPPSSAPSTTTGAGPTSTPTTTSRSEGPALTAASTLDLRGLGPVRVGMTLAEASAAAGIPIVGPAGPPECSFAAAEGGPEGIRFMVVEGRIARVDVQGGSPIRTASGAGAGDTEAEVQARYQDGLEVSPHKYVREGHYLTLVPTDSVDAELRLIFETDGSTVTRFRSGRRPEVGYIEGCS